MGTYAPLLSGRNNIKMFFAFNGNIDFYNQEICDKIIEFSELGDLIETPVYQYSSGMVARLLCSCAIFQEGDILILDEAFAGGDAGFIKKSYAVMQKKWESTPISLFVGHDVGQVLKLCNKCYVMENGRVLDFGETKKMVELYESRIYQS